MKYLLFAAVLCSSFVPARAQDKQHFSLMSALDESSRQNLVLDAQRRELKILEGRAVQAKAVPNPEIEGSIDEIPSGGSKTGDAAKQIGVTQSLEVWGKRARRAETA